MPKILEILVRIQIERSIAVSSDWNIQDHLLNIPTEICCSIFNKPVLCPNKGIRKRNKSKWL